MELRKRKDTIKKRRRNGGKILIKESKDSTRHFLKHPHYLLLGNVIF